MRIEAILLFAILVSSIYTVSASAQSTPKPNIVATSIIESSNNIPANSKNNEFLVTYANTGNAYGTKTVSLVMYANYGTDKESTHACKTGPDGLLFTTVVGGNPGESETISWKCTVYGAGPYQVKSLGKTLNFNVIDLPVNIVLDEITVSPSKPKLGDNAVFFVTMKNTDTFSGSKKISYELVFSPIDSSSSQFKASFGTKDMSLGPGESVTFTVNAVFSSELPWRFCVDDSCLHSFTLSDSPEQAPSEQTPPSEQEKANKEKQDEEARKRLQKDIEESKTEEEKQADEDRKRLEKDIEEEEETDDDTDEIEQEEEQIQGANLVVTDVTVMPRKGLKQGDAVTITVVVKNSGDAKGSKDINIIGGVIFKESATSSISKHELEVPSKTVTVEPGKEKTLKWENVAVLGHGMYHLEVDQFSTEFWVGLKNPTPTGIKALDKGIQLDPDEVREAQKTYIRSAPDAEERSKMEAFWKYMSEKQPAEKIRDLKPFDIDDAADFDTNAGESDKKKFDIDDAADFDTNSESEPFAGGILSSEDLDRIKNVSDMQVIADMESIRDKILSVDFGSVVGPSETKTESNTISQKYDAANEKLRIAIEKREQIVGLKEQLEKAKEKANELEKQYDSDFNRWKKIWKENKDGKPSTDDKIRENEALEDQYDSQEKWEASGQEIHKIENKIRELEPEANKQYDDAMKDLDSAADDLNKIMEGEPNYEDKNQKPFVTDDLKKETYQDPSRTVDDLMRITEESIKNMDALQKQNTLKQIINDQSSQASSADTFNKIMNSEFASTIFYPGDLQSLTSVVPRAELQNTVWNELADSGNLEKYKQKTLQKLEQKSEANIQQVSTQSPLVSKLQDSSYFGTIPAASNTEDVATIHLGGYDAGFGNSVISADIPIKPLFDDGNTAKYSVLGGNLAIVDPATNQIQDVLSVAFGKGRIGQDGKTTFLINAIESSGLHKTITLSSTGESSSVMISGGSRFELTSMTISNTIPLDDVSERTTQDALSRQVAEEFEQYLAYNVSNEIPSVDEWRKLQDEARKAKEQLEKARVEAEKADKAFRDSQDPKLREEVEKIKREIDQLKPEIDKQDSKMRDATGFGKYDSVKYEEALHKWSEFSAERTTLIHKFADKMSEAVKSGNPDLLKKNIDAQDKLRNAEKTANDLEKRAQDTWNKLDESAKSGRID